MSPSKFYPFSDYDRKQLAKLPPDIAALADKYPSEILNTADSWDNLPFDANYFPECLEVYSGDADDANIFVLNGVLKDYVPSYAEKNTSSITVMIDGEFAYIEVEGRQVLNKLGGIVLPEVAINPELLIQSILKGENND
ncbi:hypothetical protein [Nostoc foliaceum]|uniref:Uncharacterized protein n=1 Tax=Nostoc foliaceum FACHB-393 TaxID=2692915 RepID=A0ABR8IJX9_9NOSO|nr:hypothetical protein [Nostoc foliaceum]MBD2651184.1 hypothetical protein [Nostoc foliaceum FACHB-393]